MKSRPLKNKEREILLRQGNRSNSWESLLISDDVDCSLISGCRFINTVKITSLVSGIIRRDGRAFEVGIRNSVLSDCVIGESCVIEDVGYGYRLQIGDRVILSRIDEIFFEKGFDAPRAMIRNENGGRLIPLNRYMTGVEAFLFSEYRDNSRWVERCNEICREIGDDQFSGYCLIENDSSIRSCRRLVDILVGKEVNCLGLSLGRNICLSTHSLVDNVISLENGFVCDFATIKNGVIARNFFLGESSVLENGATLLDSFLDVNSHIACGEVVASLVGPFHVQHHKTSFLIASTINGESNLAAGAIIGSNHNSRHAEGELFAGRGFWAGLSVSLKHNSQFASFNLIEKGLYKKELNNPFPFALITRDEKEDCTVILPAYYLLYNLYALERGKKKFTERDKRVHHTFPVEVDYLSADTIGEILTSLSLLEGRGETFYLDGIEKGSSVKIVKGEASLVAYKEALLKYGVETLAGEEFDLSLPFSLFLESALSLDEAFILGEWKNICGVNFIKSDLDKLIEEENLLHEESLLLFREKLLLLIDGCSRQKRGQAQLALMTGVGATSRGEELYFKIETLYKEQREHWQKKVKETRGKDFINPFVLSSYRSPAEMFAVLGEIPGEGD